MAVERGVGGADGSGEEWGVISSFFVHSWQRDDDGMEEARSTMMTHWGAAGDAVSAISWR